MKRIPPPPPGWGRDLETWERFYADFADQARQLNGGNLAQQIYSLFVVDYIYLHLLAAEPDEPPQEAGPAPPPEKGYEGGLSPYG